MCDIIVLSCYLSTSIIIRIDMTLSNSSYATWKKTINFYINLLQNMELFTCFFFFITLISWGSCKQTVFNVIQMEIHIHALSTTPHIPLNRTNQNCKCSFTVHDIKLLYFWSHWFLEVFHRVRQGVWMW
jgi:hypothetical protein